MSKEDSRQSRRNITIKRGDSKSVTDYIAANRDAELKEKEKIIQDSLAENRRWYNPNYNKQIRSGKPPQLPPQTYSNFSPRHDDIAKQYREELVKFKIHPAYNAPEQENPEMMGQDLKFWETMLEDLNKEPVERDKEAHESRGEKGGRKPKKTKSRRNSRRRKRR